MTLLDAPAAHGADAVAQWRPPHPVDLAATIGPLRHGAGDPTQRRASTQPDERAAVWRTQRHEEGAATLRLAQLADGRLRAHAWGPGAEAAVAQAPELCGAGDDARGFAPRLPGVAAAHRRHPGLRVPRTARLFDALVPVVLEQKVIVQQAHDSWRRLVHRFGEPAPGPAGARMRVAPEAAGWRRVPSWGWHRAGVDPQRSRTVVRLAERAAAIDRLAALPAAEARERLQTLPGVGPWTAAEAAQRALGDADAVSVGDFHLAKRIGHALAGRDFDDDELLAALEPWAGQRYRAVRLILLAGPARPRRGPRLALVDHRAC